MPEFRKMKIEDRDYALLPMPPIKAVRFTPKVAKLLSSVMGAGLTVEKLTSGNQETIGAMVAGLLASVDTDQLIDLAQEAFSHECYAGSGRLSDPTHFDKWFTDHPGDMLPVCIWAIWEHSKDFLLGSAKGFQQIMGQASVSRKDGNQTSSLEES